MREVNMIKLPFARSGRWEHEGRVPTQGQAPCHPGDQPEQPVPRLHCTASFSSIQNQNKGTKLLKEKEAWDFCNCSSSLSFSGLRKCYVAPR